ncbi:MAG: CRISPR-associated helicase/endonuclease Cas3 [Bacteroidia bacterium]
MHTQLIFSHSRKDDQGNKVGAKRLQDHTAGVKAKALASLHHRLGFSLLSPSEIRDLLEVICVFHDLGKYTRYFQDYLLGKNYDQDLKTHARLGAHVAYQWTAPVHEKPLPALLAYYIILHHHLNLRGLRTSADPIFNNIEAEEVADMLASQWKSLPPVSQLIEEMELATAARQLAYATPRDISRKMRSFRETGAEYYFLINYLFSLLIEADKLDASDTPHHVRQAIAPHAVERHIAAMKPGKNDAQQRLRQEVRAAVLAHLEREDILSQRLMLLTAPTGIGKTLTALDFAIRLRDKIAQAEGRQAQIITALPFINIIEQTLDEYQQVFSSPDDASISILAHYQYADVLGEQQDAGDERGYDRLSMQLDTWQADIVITSFVQLLQTLITNRNKLLKKFNHFAGAIVIMDEVQSIRLEHMPVVGAMLFYLARYLDTRLILMTATQPLIFESAQKHILSKRGERADLAVMHLLPQAESYFRVFERTQLIPHLDEVLEDEAAFVALFARCWTPDKSCIVVCNKVLRSLRVCEALQTWLAEQGHTHPVFYLSTNVIPFHRMERIGEIKASLKAHRAGSAPAPILVATQVVEAGVDLDFDMGFRDIGPIESVVQVAGRINRENHPERRLSPLHIVQFGKDCRDVYGLLTYKQAVDALGQQPIAEPDYFDLVASYFAVKNAAEAYGESLCLFESIEKLEYDSDDRRCGIAGFQVIQQAAWVRNVFIESDDAATAAKEAFVNMLHAKGDDKMRMKKEFDQHHKRTFHQHIVAVPKYHLGDLPKIDLRAPEVDIFLVDRMQLSRCYDTATGFIRTREEPSASVFF